MKLKDFENGRLSGLEMALRIAEKDGIEALRKEVKFRGAKGINTPYSAKELGEASDKIKKRTFDTMLAISIATLHDEFGFGKKRLEVFKERMTLKTECLMDDLCSWDDYIQMIREETGVELEIRPNA